MNYCLALVYKFFFPWFPFFPHSYRTLPSKEYFNFHFVFLGVVFFVVVVVRVPVEWKNFYIFSWEWKKLTFLLPFLYLLINDVSSYTINFSLVIVCAYFNFCLLYTNTYHSIYLNIHIDKWWAVRVSFRVFFPFQVVPAHIFFFLLFSSIVWKRAMKLCFADISMRPNSKITLKQSFRSEHSSFR